MFGENSKQVIDTFLFMRALSVGMLVVALVLAGCSGQVDPLPEAGFDGSPASPAPSEAPFQPDRPRKADAPHVHDYWFGALSLVLLDESVPLMVAHNHMFDEPPREQHTHGCDETLASDSQGGSRKFSLPPGNIVLPGTEALEFLFTWSSPSITGLRLLYRPANGHDLVDAGMLVANEILRVNVTEEMADAGHTTRTKWVFFICAASEQPMDVAEGDVRTNILALRAAELPLEPPHPDVWKDSPTLHIANARFSNKTVTALNKGESAWLHVPIEHGVTIPPGTGTVRVLVNATPSAALSSLAPENLLVYYRDSSVPEWVYRIATATSSNEADLMFEIPVDHDMADGVYSHETNWDLWLRLASAARAPTAAGVMSAPYSFEGTLNAIVIAEREASSEND